jgi:hypothetical protein
MKRWQWIVLVVLILVTLVVEMTVLRGVGGHWWNHVPGFYLWLGGGGFLLIIFVSKALGKKLLFRKEDYYER